MKKMKKLASLVLALAMALTLAVPALAAETTYTLTLNNAQAGHTYTAYQVFAGDLSGSTLSNVVWGDGVTAEGQTALGNAAEKADNIVTASDAETFAAEVAPYLETAAGSVTITEGATSGTISNLEAGYYLIKTTAVTEENGVYTYYIFKVVKNTTANIKADAPEVKKAVDDNDANIGDTVTFTLTATMPSNLQGYEKYKVIFHDTLSAGLAFVEGTVKVTVDGAEKTSAFTSTHDNGTLTISCNDVLAETVGATVGGTIVVTYDAILDDDAVIGTAGNPNKVYLEYSNDPNWNGTGNEPTGETPEKEVEVYTWEIPVFKYTGADTALAGAGFTLYTDAECTAAVNLVATEDSTIYKVCTQADCKDHTHVNEIMTGETGKFEIKGLEKDTYYLKETATPAGYNTLSAPVTVVISDNGKITNTSDDNTVKIQNNSGAELPSTGGMGTTLFYALGAVLVIGAGVAMVTKKRMA